MVRNLIFLIIALAVMSPLSASKTINRKWVLKRRPVGVFDPELDSELVEEEVALSPSPSDDDDQKKQHLGETEIVVKPQLLSIDAFLRTMLDEKAYHGSLPLGGVLPALGYGRVVLAGPKSGHKIGSRVAGMLQAADYAKVDGSQVMRAFKLPFMSMSSSLGIMGITCGLTAYCGVFYVAPRPPRRGETVVVTAASGAVGSVAVQLCKSTGAKVVGVAGGKAKGDYLKNELNCDGVVDYKDRSKSLDDQIRDACPDGIDFVFDNVGGEILDALLFRTNPKSRIVVCGAISQYSGNLNKECEKTGKPSKVEGPSNYLKLAERGASMTGFNVMQHLGKLPFMMVGMFYLWMRGRVRMTEHFEDGLESFPLALQKLFTGKTIGKTLVRISKD